MKKLAIFDIDGVIYQGHLIFDVIQDQEKKGIIKSGTWDKILFELGEYKSGRKSYKQAADNMLSAYADSLEGKEYEYILDHNSNYLIENKDKFFTYFTNLVSKLCKTHDIYFVTTNFQFTAEAVGKIFGIKNYLSSVAEVKNGLFTGKVELSLGGNKGIVSALVGKYGKKGSIVVGDSENDEDMLVLSEFPLIMEPNERLEKIANKNNWQIVNRYTIADTIIKHAR